MFRVTPACKRAVAETVSMLRAAGHEVVPFALPHMEDLWLKYYDHVLSDGGETTVAVLNGDVWDKSLRFHMLLWKTPR